METCLVQRANEGSNMIITGRAMKVVAHDCCEQLYTQDNQNLCSLSLTPFQGMLDITINALCKALIMKPLSVIQLNRLW